MLEKRYLLLSWSLLCFAGYLSAMGLTYGDEGRYVLKFHIESEWQSIGILLSTPFVFYALPKLRPTVGLSILIAIFLVRFAYISSAYDKFSWRVKTTESILDKMNENGITKLALVNNDSITRRYILTWALSEESMLMSAMRGDNPQRTVTFFDPGDSAFISQLKIPSNVAVSFEMAVPVNWNYRYFKPDTARAYTFMTYDELFAK